MTIGNVLTVERFPNIFLVNFTSGVLEKQKKFSLLMIFRNDVEWARAQASYEGEYSRA